MRKMNLAMHKHRRNQEKVNDSDRLFGSPGN